jgi:hypothetical protein
MSYPFIVPADILANSVWQIRRAMTATVIAHTRVTSRPSVHASADPDVGRHRAMSVATQIIRFGVMSGRNDAT